MDDSDAPRARSPLPLYEAARDRLSTGDIVAFGGKGRVSSLIKWKGGTPYSHLAMVLETHVEGAGDSVLIVESTSLIATPDAVAREVRSGVQMHWLAQRLTMYEGAAWWVPVTAPFPPGGRDAMIAWARETHARRVPYDLAQALGAGLDFLERLVPGLANEPDFSALFCSELVARLLQLGGVLAPELNPSELQPWEVVGQPCCGPPALIKPED